MEDSLVESYPCELCQKVFNTKSVFIKHIKFVHQFSEALDPLLLPDEAGPAGAEPPSEETVSKEPDIELVAEVRKSKSSPSQNEPLKRAKGLDQQHQISGSGVTNTAHGLVQPASCQICRQDNSSCQHPVAEEAETELTKPGLMTSTEQASFNEPRPAYGAKIITLPGNLGQLPVRLGTVRPAFLLGPRGQAGGDSPVLLPVPAQPGRLPAPIGPITRFYLPRPAQGSCPTSSGRQIIIIKGGDLSKIPGLSIPKPGCNSPQVLTFRPGAPSRFVPILPSRPANSPPVGEVRNATSSETPAVKPADVERSQPEVKTNFNGSSVSSPTSIEDPKKKGGPKKFGHDAVCRICDIVLKNPQNMSRHIKAVHQNLRPHACGICGTAYKQGDHLRRHLKRAHEIAL